MKASRNNVASRGLNAFTLIELLVVMSIVSLLIAILLPALGAARKSSKMIACGSNERQIGVAMLAYASDYHDTFPSSLVPTSLTGLQWWTQPWSYALLPYTNRKMDSSSTRSAQWSIWGGVFNCVGKPDFDMNIAGDIHHVSYSMNAFVQGGRVWKKLDQIQNASTLLLISDEGGGNIETRNYIFTWHDYPAFWHPSQTNNVLMCDGHVETLNVDGIGSTYKGWVSGNTAFELRKAN